VGEKLTPDEIRKYWIEHAETHGASPAASWSDVCAINLEIREIVKWLEDGDRVLDVGCGNGYSSAQFAASLRIRLRGVDYVPAMVQQARARAAELAGRLAGSLEFVVGDVLELDESPDAYDKVITTRVVINLGDWDRQRAALLGCARVLRPGGLLLLSEATLQGWQNLNAFRAEWGLQPIPMPPFNTYLDEPRVLEALAPAMTLVEQVSLSSTYFVGTRILKPLLIQALGLDIDVADPNMHWNQWWASLPARGDYGTQKLFVFRKR
jgi:ubiquinone/menaquinone biosynthesis C-methylase UbiE